MVSKKRGQGELNPRYKKIIRSMLLNNFVLNLNNVAVSTDFLCDDKDEDSQPPINDGISVIGFCG